MKIPEQIKEMMANSESQESFDLRKRKSCKIAKKTFDNIMRFGDNKVVIGDNEYQCAMCYNVYSKGWTDEEAIAEFNESFEHTNETVMVCDDCYNKMIPQMN